jgi:hypothetical protein
MKLKHLLIFLPILLFTYLFINFSIDKQDLSGDFKSKDIRLIALGDSLEEVLQKLGRPYKIESLAGLHELKCKAPKDQLIMDIRTNTNIRKIVNLKFSEKDYCCSGNKEDLVNKRVTLVYSNRVEFSNHYPMLWIKFDKDFRVNSVFAKQYEGYLGLEEPCIYSLNQDQHFENKELFEKNFD